MPNPTCTASQDHQADLCAREEAAASPLLARLLDAWPGVEGSSGPVGLAAGMALPRLTVGGRPAASELLTSPHGGPAGRLAAALETEADRERRERAGGVPTEHDLAAIMKRSSKAPGYDTLRLVAMMGSERFLVGTPREAPEGTLRSSEHAWRAYPVSSYHPRAKEPFAPFAPTTGRVLLMAVAECPFIVDAGPTASLVERALGAEAAGQVIATAEHALEGLLPSWGPAEAFDMVCQAKWYGEEDHSLALEEIKDQISYERQDTARRQQAADQPVTVDPDAEVTDEEALGEAEGWLWTLGHVRSHLPEPYTSARPVERRSEAGLIARAASLDDAARGEGEPQVALAERLALIFHLARRCEGLTRSLAARYPIQTDEDEVGRPFGFVIVTDHRRAGKEAPDSYQHSMVVETFEEAARHEAEYAAFTAPACGVAVDPNCPQEVRRAQRFLKHLALAEDACLRLVSALCEGSLDWGRLSGGSGDSGATGQSATQLRPATHVSQVIDERFRDDEVRAGAQSLAAFSSGSRLSRRGPMAERVGLPRGVSVGV